MREVGIMSQKKVIDKRTQHFFYLEHLADHLLLGANEEAHDVIAQRVPVLVEEALHAVPHLTRVVLHTKLQRVHARAEWKKVHWKIREQ